MEIIRLPQRANGRFAYSRHFQIKMDILYMYAERQLGLFLVFTPKRLSRLINKKKGRKHL